MAEKRKSAFSLKIMEKIMKICIITGGARGLGLDMSLRFASLGYKVIVLDIIKTPQESVDFIQTDLSNPDEITQAFSEIDKKYGKAHVLINNAAIASFEKKITQTTLQEIDAVLDVNLRGAYLCAKAFIPLNANENYGRIINIASTRWHQNMADWELYGMSKGGIVSLTNTLCVSLLGTPITVNAISPGYIHTGLLEELTEDEHKIHPSNRVGKPRDITNACVFLAHEENDFINGANIIIDGGMTKKMIY